MPGDCGPVQPGGRWRSELAVGSRHQPFGRDCGQHDGDGAGTGPTGGRSATGRIGPRGRAFGAAALASAPRPPVATLGRHRRRERRGGGTSPRSAITSSSRSPAAAPRRSPGRSRAPAGASRRRRCRHRDRAPPAPARPRRSSCVDRRRRPAGIAALPGREPERQRPLRLSRSSITGRGLLVHSASIPCARSRSVGRSLSVGVGDDSLQEPVEHAAEPRTGLEAELAHEVVAVDREVAPAIEAARRELLLDRVAELDRAGSSAGQPAARIVRRAAAGTAPRWPRRRRSG